MISTVFRTFFSEAAIRKPFSRDADPHSKLSLEVHLHTDCCVSSLCHASSPRFRRRSRPLLPRSSGHQHIPSLAATCAPVRALITTPTLANLAEDRKSPKNCLVCQQEAATYWSLRCNNRRPP